MFNIIRQLSWDVIFVHNIKTIIKNFLNKLIRVVIF